MPFRRPLLKFRDSFKWHERRQHLEDDVDALEDRTIYGTRKHDWSAPKSAEPDDEESSQPGPMEEVEVASQQSETTHKDILAENPCEFPEKVTFEAIAHEDDEPNADSDDHAECDPASRELATALYTIEGNDQESGEWRNDGGSDLDVEDDMDSLIDEVNGMYTDEEELPIPRLATVTDVSSIASSEKSERRKKLGDGVVAYVQEEGFWVREMRSQGEIVEREILEAGVI